MPYIVPLPSSATPMTLESCTYKNSNSDQGERKKSGNTSNRGPQYPKKHFQTGSKFCVHEPDARI